MTYPTLIPCKNSQIIIIALTVINPKKVALGKQERGLIKFPLVDLLLYFTFNHVSYYSSSWLLSNSERQITTDLNRRPSNRFFLCFSENMEFSH